MSWMYLDDRILEHPKFIRAVKRGGSEVLHMWLGIRAYCGQHLTDGHVPADMLDEVRGPTEPRKRAKALDVLKEVGLLEEVPGGLQMHDYLDWSKSRDDVIASRVSARERQAKSRKTSQRLSQRDSTCDSQSDERETSASVTTPLPLPIPNPEDPKAGEVVAEDLSGLRAGDAQPPPPPPRGALRDRLVEKPHAPGYPPLRHDPMHERIPFGRWFPSLALLDWAASRGLSPDAVDAVVTEARDKLTGTHDVDWYDVKFARFVDVAVERRSKPSGPNDQLARQLERVARLEAEERAGAIDPGAAAVLGGGLLGAL